MAMVELEILLSGGHLAADDRPHDVIGWAQTSNYDVCATRPSNYDVCATRR